jgi:small-conductance mechanosensitive channel
LGSDDETITMSSMATEETASGYLSAHVDAIRSHIVSLLAAVPTLPAELAQVKEQIVQEATARGPGTLILLTIAFIVLGLLVEGAYRKSVKQKSSQGLVAIGLRFARDLGALAAFTLGSAVVFLAFDWPPRTRGEVLAFLTALITLRLVIIVSRVLLSPRDAALRVLPVSDGDAHFWHWRAAFFAGWFAFGWMLVERLGSHGLAEAPRQLVAYMLGLGLLAIAVEAVWRSSRAAAVICLALWLLWVAKAMGLFWLLLVAAVLPVALPMAQRAAEHLLHPGMAAAALGRALRALLIIGAAFLLLRAFNLQVDTLASGDSMGMQLLRGAVNALAIVLILDLAWKVAAAFIDQKLAAAGTEPLGPSATDEQHRHARVRTLLPIVRSTLAATLVVTAVLMALSALGVKVAPLLAGAGVVGVAIGFGSQTLVRDLLSKFFYLLDDAFRVGEYIQSGNYKGTVEHLGVRSVRLRHHRGPLFTIPYGQLGAVQNMSRDWVIDKMTLGLVYGTDLDKVKKLLKQIGKELSANPEFAPDILEPLKMQGVDNFGDFAIQVRLKMKTLPNKQFTIRRRAYAMIQKVFAENGIQFAFPTVQVAGQGDVSAAVAKQALDIAKSA